MQRWVSYSSSLLFLTEETQIAETRMILGLRSSGMLRDVGWLLVIDISGQPIDSILKGLSWISLLLKMGAKVCPKTSGTS